MPKRRSKSKRRIPEPAPAKRWRQTGLWRLVAVGLVVTAVVILLRQSRVPEEDAASMPHASAPSARPAETRSAPRELEPLASVTTKDSQLKRAAEQRGLDPLQDGWRTEAFAESAKEVLSELVERAVRSEVGNTAVLRSLVSPEFRGTELRPDELVVVCSGCDDQSHDGSARPIQKRSKPTKGSPVWPRRFSAFAEPLHWQF